MWLADIWDGYSDPVWINMEIRWLFQVSLPGCLGAHGPLAQEPAGTSEAALCSAQINAGSGGRRLAGLHRIWDWSKASLHLQTLNMLAPQWSERSFSPGTAVGGGCKTEVQLFLRKAEGMFWTFSWDKLLEEWVQPPFVITPGKAYVMPSLHHLRKAQGLTPGFLSLEDAADAGRYQSLEKTPKLGNSSDFFWEMEKALGVWKPGAKKPCYVLWYMVVSHCISLHQLLCRQALALKKEMMIQHCLLCCGEGIRILI